MKSGKMFYKMLSESIAKDLDTEKKLLQLIAEADKRILEIQTQRYNIQVYKYLEKQTIQLMLEKSKKELSDYHESRKKPHYDEGCEDERY